MSDNAAAPASPDHPWRRYVALGDSFTEGLGDPEPAAQGGFRGWADRVAEQLAMRADGFAYANLAVRGKLIAQIVEEQVQPALALRPDLITISAGGNDVLHIGSDPDEIGAQFDAAVAELSRDDATIVVFTGVDVRFSPVFRPLRGKVAIYNENIRLIARKYDCIVADMWALHEVQDQRMWSEDRLHMNALGHHTVARMVLEALAVENDLAPLEPAGPLPQNWRQARVDDLHWAREHLVPWVIRRIRHQSSGDGRLPKRPRPASITPIEALEPSSDLAADPARGTECGA